MKHELVLRAVTHVATSPSDEITDRDRLVAIAEILSDEGYLASKGRNNTVNSYEN